MENILAQLQDATIKVLLNSLLIHLICRFAVFARRPTIYDESPYVMKLMSKDSTSLDDDDTAHDDTESSEEEKTTSSKKKSRSRSKSPFAKKATTSSKEGDLQQPFIVVTGSSGRIGSAVVQALIEDGKFMPPGLVFIVSVAMAAFYVYKLNSDDVGTHAKRARNN